jgi:hypothetical protein
MQNLIVLVLGLCLTIGSALIAAPSQDRPGMPTQARVWVENRRADEAVPVTVVQRPSDRPARVEIVSAAATVIRTRRTPDVWEYRSVVVPATADAAAALEAVGREGWEVTGVQFPAPNGAVLLLKRPRSS